LATTSIAHEHLVAGMLDHPAVVRELSAAELEALWRLVIAPPGADGHDNHANPAAATAAAAATEVALLAALAAVVSASRPADAPPAEAVIAVLGMRGPGYHQGSCPTRRSTSFALTRRRRCRAPQLARVGALPLLRAARL